MTIYVSRNEICTLSPDKPSNSIINTTRKVQTSIFNLTHNNRMFVSQNTRERRKQIYINHTPKRETKTRLTLFTKETRKQSVTFSLTTVVNEFSNLLILSKTPTVIFTLKTRIIGKSLCVIVLLQFFILSLFMHRSCFMHRSLFP